MLSPIERLALRGVRAIDPRRNLDAIVDVRVEAGEIAEIAPARAAPLEETGDFDAAGLWLVPSFTDLRARLGEPGFEYKETLVTGLRAAAAGGFGAVCALPDTQPINDRGPVLEAMLAGARQAQAAELLPVAALTRGLRGAELTEIGELLEKGAVALSDADHYVASARVMRRALEYASTFDALVMQQPTELSLTEGSVMHEGEVSSRLGVFGSPSAAEEIGLLRDLSLVRQTGARYHAAALSTKESVEHVAKAKADGLRVSADVSFANLLLNDAVCESYDSRYRVVPPLRGEADRVALLAGLVNGTIDAITTNHSPETPLEQDCEFDQAAPGMMGLELCLSLLLELCARAELSLSRLINALSIRPAEILGRQPPSLAVGAPANFTLIDPERRWLPKESPLQTKCRNTPFLDRELRGKVLMTASRGALIFSLNGVAPNGSAR